MTTVLVDLAVASRHGSTDPALGRLLVTPLRRHREGDTIILEHAYAQVLVDGKTTLELDPTTAGTTGWKIYEEILGGGGITRYVSVPAASDDPVQYADLPDIDPETLI